MEIFENSFDFFVNLHVGPLEPEIAQIFGRAETAGKNDSGESSRNELFERQDGSSGDSGRLGENASDLVHRLANLVIDDVSL